MPPESTARPVWRFARYIKMPLVAAGHMSDRDVLHHRHAAALQRAADYEFLAPDVIGDHYTPNLYAYTVAFTNQQYNYSAAISFVPGRGRFVASYAFMS